MTGDVDRHFHIADLHGIVTITCALCNGFELLTEGSTEGRKRALEREALHLQLEHEDRSA